MTHDDELRGCWRMAGFCGIGFMTIVVLGNVLRSATAPLNDASAETIARYFVEREASSWILMAASALNFPLLLFFAAGLRSYAARRSPVAELWGTAGFGAGVMISALFMAHNGVLAALQANAPVLSENLRVTRFVWDVSSGIFWVNTGAVATALFCLSRAAAHAGLGPKWCGTLGIVASLLMIVCSPFPVAWVLGKQWLALGFIGFIGWLVWGFAIGISLVRVGRSAVLEGTIAVG